MHFEVAPQADDDLSRMDSSIRAHFISHFQKILRMPPRRHLRFGVPMHVEKVTEQARFVYKIEGDLLSVVRCFATHKEYEKWYRSFR